MSTALVAAPSGLPRLDSKTILEQKGKLDAMVENAKQQILDLKEDIQSGTICAGVLLSLSSARERWIHASLQSR